VKSIAQLGRKRRLSVDDALELLDAAVHLEDDERARRVYEQTHGARSVETLGEALGNLHERLKFLGVNPELLRKMGKAFERASMVVEATEFIGEQWERLLDRYNVTLLSGWSQHVTLRADIAAAWLMRPRNVSSRFDEPQQIRRIAPARTNCTCAICRDLRAPRLTVVDDWRANAATKDDGAEEYIDGETAVIS